ncbi:MAG: DUF2179 domain-containing protein [Kiritimatiellia bacterium]
MQDFTNFPLFTWVIIPMLICLGRIIDVSLGTLRIIFVSRGMKLFAAVLGFFEILIWLVAIGQIMQNLTHVGNYFAYATGFAIGNYVGIILEEKLAIGKITVRIITNHDATELIAFLRKKKFLVTVVDAEGSTGAVNILFTAIWRSQLPVVKDYILRFNPQAFYTVEDIRYVSGGDFFDPAVRWRAKRGRAVGKMK